MKATLFSFGMLLFTKAFVHIHSTKVVNANDSLFMLIDFHSILLLLSLTHTHWLHWCLQLNSPYNFFRVLNCLFIFFPSFFLFCLFLVKDVICVVAACIYNLKKKKENVTTKRKLEELSLSVGGGGGWNSHNPVLFFVFFFC